MPLSSEQEKKIAQLAALRLSEEEAVQYLPELTKILQFIEKIDQAETTSLAPLAHPLDLTQRLREDCVTETNEREHFQKIAPAVEAGLYLVPKVIEES